MKNKFNIPVIINKNYYVNNSIDKYSNDDIYLYHQRIISNEIPVIRAGIRLIIVRKAS